MHYELSIYEEANLKVLTQSSCEEIEKCCVYYTCMRYQEAKQKSGITIESLNKKDGG